MKTIFITGAGGWLGLELTARFLTSGYKVRALDMVLNDQLKQFQKEYPSQLVLIKGNLDEIDAWKEELYEVDELYHFAAKVHLKPKCKEDINQFYHINRDCTKQLFDVALNQKVKKVIFISTVAVYGLGNNQLISPTSSRKPVTPYGISKNDAEMYGLYLKSKFNFPITIVQPVTVYGGNDRGNFRKLYNLSKKGISFRLGSGENKKTVIHYKDLVTMIQNIGDSNDTLGETIICGTEVISYNQVINKFINVNKPLVKINIPSVLVKIATYLSVIRVPIIINIIENIKTLTSSNIFEIEGAKKYLEKDRYISFNEWNCQLEYEGEKL